MSLITRCPNCSTLFKVVTDQLRISGGWVRCGHCQEVFDASANLISYEESRALAQALAAEEPPQPSPTPPPPPPPSPVSAAGEGRSGAGMESTHGARASTFDIPDTASLLRRPESADVVLPRFEVQESDATGVAAEALDDSTPAAVETSLPNEDLTPEPMPSAPQAEESVSLPATASAEDPEPTPSVPEPAMDFPQELEAWREARARSRGEQPDDPIGPTPRTLPEPVDATTRPSPLWPLEPAAEPVQPATRRPALDHDNAALDEAAAERRADSAPLEAMAGSPVDFVLSDMGRWQGGMDDGGAAIAPAIPTPAKEPEAAPGAAPEAEAAPSFVAAAQRRAFWRSRPMRIALGLAVLLLLAALVLQVAISRRSWLAAHVPSLAPALTALCQPLGCTVAPLRDLDAIVIDSSAFNRSGPSSFRFTVTLRNQSAVPVATPALELTLTDALEQPVVRRIVEPAELNAPDTLAPQGEFAGANALVLTGVDNANAITGYRLMAFYP